jgi:hypothetical protein
MCAISYPSETGPEDGMRDRDRRPDRCCTAQAGCVESGQLAARTFSDRLGGPFIRKLLPDSTPK